jgi:hypothetical protein
LLTAGQATIASAGAAQTVTIAPASPTTVANCFPFGSGINWALMGFVYQNVPAFQVKTGDTIAFDLGGTNTQADPQLDIEMSATTTNGGDVPQAFTKVVTNTQTPANPRGDLIKGNFELKFIAQAPFSFPGGGLIIRFSNPSASYMTAANCEADLVGTSGADVSGHFVKRFFEDPDGVPPYANQDANPGNLGGFQLTLADVPPTPQTPVVTKKKKCKKHKHHAASAKKHCKKKKK